LKEELGGKAERLTKVEEAEFHLEDEPAASPNTAYTLRANSLAFRDILLWQTSYMLGTLDKI
jgi:hypothetical protein